MNLFRYSQDHSAGSTLLKMMEDHGVKLDYRIHEAVDEFCERRYILKYDRDKPKYGIGWRLTYPAWAVYFVLLIVVVCPVLWLFTGRYNIDHLTKLAAFTKAWANRLF